MTKELYALSLDELKALHKEGKLTRNDLLMKNYDDKTLNHYIAEYTPEAFQIFQWEYKKGLLTREDLLIKNNDGARVLDCLSEEDREAVLALFDKKEDEQKTNVVKGNFIQKTAEKSFFDLEVDFVLKNLNVIDSDLEGDSQVYLSVGDLKEAEKVTLEFERKDEMTISLKIVRNLKNEEKLFEQDYEIDQKTFKKIIKVVI